MQLLCSRTCSAQPATRWLVGRLSALASRAPPPRLALTPRTRRMQRCGRPSRRRLRVRRRPAPPEPTGPRRRGRLAGVQRPSQKQRNCAFSTVRGQRLSPAVDNDSLEVTTSTRSRTRSSRRDGRCACHMRARRLDDAVDGPRAPQSGAAQQEQPPWLHDVNHTYHRTHLLLSAALHDLTPTFSR